MRLVFNIHSGIMQYLPAQIQDIPGGGMAVGVGVGPRSRMSYIPKSPLSRISMAETKTGKTIGYTADEIGNIIVEIPEHARAFMEYGYPIYKGDGKVLRPEDLIWPNLTVTPDKDPYQQLVLGLLSAKKG